MGKTRYILLLWLIITRFSFSQVNLSQQTELKVIENGAELLNPIVVVVPTNI